MRVNLSLPEYWLKRMRKSAEKEDLSFSVFVKDLYKYVYETRYGLTEEEFKVLEEMARKENRDIKGMITHLLKVDMEKIHHIKQYR